VGDSVGANIGDIVGLCVTIFDAINVGVEVTSFILADTVGFVVEGHTVGVHDGFLDGLTVGSVVGISDGS